jgi:DNA invertase Pin-like site-specific DNA recombinase/predicted site-specific integrase-resolvase
VVAVNGESKITASHRSRTAIVYLRQSTMLQVREHTESTERQYALAELAVTLGWPAENVLVIDADLGVSGRFGTVRGGFHELVAKVCLAEAGAVFGLEVSRLARSEADIARLLELARLTDTLVIDADGVYDLADFNDRLLLGLKGSMSAAELHLLNGRLQGAKKQAAARGELRVPLPVGFVYDADDDQVVKDPDEQVQAAIGDVFAEFERTGSGYGTVAAFAGRLFPLRAYGGVWDGQLRWGRLTHGRVIAVLANPVYAGAYVYGRHRTVRRVRPDGTVKTTSPRVPREQWQVCLTGHHEGYITWAQHLDIEAKLAANRTHDGARPAREGQPLCQGIISCGSCGGRIGTRYQGTTSRAYYDCMSHRDSARTLGCRSIAAATVDDAVAALLMTTLTTEQVALALDAAEEVAGRHARAQRSAELAVERARFDADRAERSFAQVEPENRLVARTLEVRWEAKLAALAEAEANLVAQSATRPPLPGRAELEALAADLPRLWDGPATTAKDRKRLIRTLISDVTLLPGDQPHQVAVGVRWHTGAVDRITVGRKGPDRTPEQAAALIRELGPQLNDEKLLAELTAAGLRTGKGRPFDLKAVRWARHALKVRTPRTAALPDGQITVKAAAAILDVKPGAVYYWVEHHRLQAVKDAGGRWRIIWSPEIEADCRAKIAASGHLNPAGPGSRPLPDPAPDEITVHQAAAVLGIDDEHIYYWIRIGRLPAGKDDTGRWHIPWTARTEQQARDWLEHPDQFQPRGPGCRPAADATDTEISIQHAASKLGVLPAAVAYQVREGRVPARRTDHGRVLITWNNDTQAMLRQYLDRPNHPGPTGIGSHPLPDDLLDRGEISVHQAATRLGVQDPVVYYWIRTGQITARKADHGRVAIPWDDDVHDACRRLAAQTTRRLTTPTTQEEGAV